MTEVHQEKQEGQKTVVAFVVGLLVGGLLVWVFSSPGAEAPVTETGNDADSEMTSDDAADEGAERDVTSNTNGSALTGNDKGGDTPAPAVLPVGDASVDVSDQPAGMTVKLNGATFPTSTGWIGVRTYANGQLGSVLGAALYSEAEGLVPEEIPLLVSTVPGNEYAIVFYTEDGDREFRLANDVQIDTEITNFVAQ